MARRRKNEKAQSIQKRARLRTPVERAAGRRERRTEASAGDVRLAERKGGAHTTNPWKSGSFYVFAYLAVFGSALAATRWVDPSSLPGLLGVTLSVLAVIGAMQLCHDGRMTEWSLLAMLSTILPRRGVRGHTTVDGKDGTVAPNLLTPHAPAAARGGRGTHRRA